jgi:CheY-like chemotaxis protein
VTAASDLPPAQADANQLEMAILNLSVNARDAMPSGGALTIAAAAASIGDGHRSHLPPGDYIGLSVADTGVGMDEATLARAIEPFFSTKGAGRGTGLGLSMAHGLASQLGGALTIASMPGHGSNVELWLPVSRGTATPSVAAETPIVAGAASGVVLLVDDEVLARDSTAAMLVELGYEVVEAASGEEAMRIVLSGRPIDILVTDHLMPGMSGAELAGAVRLSRPGVPVLVVSGYAEAIPADLPRLGKPYRRAELAAGVTALVAEKRA